MSTLYIDTANARCGRFLNSGSFDSAEESLDGIAYQEGSFNHDPRRSGAPLPRSDSRDGTASLFL